MTVSMEDFLLLKNRVEKLEQKEQQKEDEEVEWALNQFRYKSMTSDERKALAIIEKRLGAKKSMLRAKGVPCQH